MQFQIIVDERSIIEQIEAVAAPMIKELTGTIESNMKLSMAESKHGRIDRRGHQASAVGEAPAVDSSFLIDSIQSKINSPTFGIVTVGAEYGWILDTLRKRPFVDPAIDSAIKGLGS